MTAFAQQRPWKLAVALALAGLWLAGPAPAASPQPAKPRARAVLEKGAPEGIEDLRAIEKQLKKVLKKVVPCTVGVRVGGAQGSGVIVTQDGYVLTAAHVSGKPGREVTLILPDGRKVKARTLGGNRGIDSGLIKITEQGKWPFAEMGNSAHLAKGQWCIAVGHPGGFRAGRSPPVRLGRIQESRPNFIRTDCTLVGGDSGGPLFDMKGKVIGIHSSIGGRLTANIHVPVNTYRETWDRLAKSEIWGSRFGGRLANQPWLGVEADPEAEDCKIARVVPGSPADKAGLKNNDVVTRFDGQKIETFEELGSRLRKKKPGDKVTLEVLRGKEMVTLTAVIGKREE